MGMNVDCMVAVRVWCKDVLMPGSKSDLLSERKFAERIGLLRGTMLKSYANQTDGESGLVLLIHDRLPLKLARKLNAAVEAEGVKADLVRWSARKEHLQTAMLKSAMKGNGFVFARTDADDLFSRYAVEDLKRMYEPGRLKVAGWRRGFHYRWGGNTLRDMQRAYKTGVFSTMQGWCVDPSLPIAAKMDPYDANHANVVKYMREELGMTRMDAAEAVVCLDGARPTPAFVWMRNRAGTPMNASMDAPEEDLKYPETTRTPTHPQFRTLFGTDIPYDEVR